jgi:ferredoxin
MKLKADRYLCQCCLNCRKLLNIDDNNGFPKMPNMAYNGWDIRRITQEQLQILRRAEKECPERALEIEE